MKKILNKFPPGAHVFDMATDDNIEGQTQQLMEDIAEEEDTSKKMALHKQQQLLEEAKKMMQDIQQHPVAARRASTTATPFSTYPQAYASASSSSMPLQVDPAASSAVSQPMEVVAESSKRTAPEDEHEPKGKRGRPPSVQRLKSVQSRISDETPAVENRGLSPEKKN